MNEIGGGRRTVYNEGKERRIEVERDDAAESRGFLIKEVFIYISVLTTLE